jgi:hypothetical protein
MVAEDKQDISREERRRQKKQRKKEAKQAALDEEEEADRKKSKDRKASKDSGKSPAKDKGDSDKKKRKREHSEDSPDDAPGKRRAGNKHEDHEQADAKHDKHNDATRLAPSPMQKVEVERVMTCMMCTCSTTGALEGVKWRTPFPRPPQQASDVRTLVMRALIPGGEEPVAWDLGDTSNIDRVVMLMVRCACVCMCVNLCVCVCVVAFCCVCVCVCRRPGCIVRGK